MARARQLGFLRPLLLVTAAGCGGSKLYPVEGKILYSDSQAAVELAGGSVEFDPLEGKASARGPIEANGSFRLGTLQPEDGAAPGSYRVCIQPPLRDLDWPAQQRLLPRRYEAFETSGLEVTIKPGRNPLTLIVERAKLKR